MLDKQTRPAPHQLDINREWIVSEYGDQAPAILYEMQHYNLHGCLPQDAWVIERVEWIGEGAMIIHRDPNQVRM